MRAPHRRAADRRWISGEAARADVQHWRARSWAVLPARAPCAVDDPQLDVRLDYGPWVRQPLRVVLDTRPSLRARREYLQAIGGALIFAASGAAGHDGRAQRVLRVPRAAEGVDLERRHGSLAIAKESTNCWSSADRDSPRLSCAHRLVDELILYVAPQFLGAGAAPLADLRALVPGEAHAGVRIS